MKPKALPPLDPNQRYTINEACDYLRISRGFVYKQIKAGTLPTISEGSRTFIPGAAIADRSRVPDKAA
jgi:excisionase family DNA binding protein